MKKLLLSYLILVLMLSGCGKARPSENAASTDGAENSNMAESTDAAETAETTAQIPLNIIDDKYRTTYEIFVYSFYDSNGDGIGDLKGVTKMLDYINDGDDSTDTDLGFNEIWLMPISPSPTYHKYDVTDYCEIDPEYGTLEDFDELLTECHKRGVRVIIDTVFNHSSSEHPWFKEAAEYLKSHPGIEIEYSEDAGSTYPEDALSECRYLGYYNFTNDKAKGFEPLSGTDYYYEARFWSGMPDLNLYSEEVRGEFTNITDFWIKRGVDGFRLDATTSYYTGNDLKNIEFMTWLNDTVKGQDPDAYIVGEAWVNSATYHKYYESGIDSFFDFDYAGSEGIIAGTVRGNSPAVRYSDSLHETESAIAKVNPEAVNAPFYTNHDMARSSGYYTGSEGEDKVKLAEGLNLLMAGNAFVYYGEELGMKGSGKDENKRAPMYWTGEGSGDAPEWLSEADLKGGMCKGPKDMDDVKMKYPPVDQQAMDPHSIYNYVKKAVRLRNTYPVIARGTTTTVSELSDSEVCAFTRAMDDDKYESLLIVINASGDEKSVDIGKSAASAQYSNLAFSLDTSEAESSFDGSTLTIPAFGIAVLTK